MKKTRVNPNSAVCQNRIDGRRKCSRKAVAKRGGMPVCNPCLQMLRAAFGDI